MKTTSSSQKRIAVRRLLEGDGVVVSPGAYDCIGAKLIEQAGFDAVYIGGFAATATLIGMPDLGLITLTELTNHIRNINQATSLPIIADCESGFGNAINVMRAVREYERAGVSALHIEDQMVPKKYLPDRKPQVFPSGEQIRKIEAAVSAKEDKNLIIIGRTDALGRYGLEEAINRANRYHEAGCDMVFVHGITKPQDIQTVGERISAPMVFNYTSLFEAGVEHFPRISELKKLGFRIILFPGDLLFSAAKKMKEVLALMKERGDPEYWKEDMMSVNEFRNLLDMDRYEELEGRYLPAIMPNNLVVSL